MLRIAIPAGKSLEKPSLRALAKIGAFYQREGARLTFGTDMLSSGVVLKPKRIPGFVAEGLLDIGIVGSDILYYTDWWGNIVSWGSVPIGRILDGKTCIMLCASAKDPLAWTPTVDSSGMSEEKCWSLAGKTILSEYPVFTTRMLKAYGVEATVEPSPGSAEAEVGLKYRYAICLSETGRSLRENNLVAQPLMECSTLLIANPDVYADPEKRMLIGLLGKALGGE